MDNINCINMVYYKLEAHFFNSQLQHLYPKNVTLTITRRLQLH